MNAAIDELLSSTSVQDVTLCSRIAAVLGVEGDSKQFLHTLCSDVRVDATSSFFRIFEGFYHREQQVPEDACLLILLDDTPLRDDDVPSTSAFSVVTLDPPPTCRQYGMCPAVRALARSALDAGWYETVYSNADIPVCVTYAFHNSTQAAEVHFVKCIMPHAIQSSCVHTYEESRKRKIEAISDSIDDAVKAWQQSPPGKTPTIADVSEALPKPGMSQEYCAEALLPALLYVYMITRIKEGRKLEGVRDVRVVFELFLCYVFHTGPCDQEYQHPRFREFYSANSSMFSTLGMIAENVLDPTRSPILTCNNLMRNGQVWEVVQPYACEIITKYHTLCVRREPHFMAQKHTTKFNWFCVHAPEIEIREVITYLRGRHYAEQARRIKVFVTHKMKRQYGEYTALVVRNTDASAVDIHCSMRQIMCVEEPYLLWLEKEKSSELGALYDVFSGPNDFHFLIIRKDLLYMVRDIGVALKFCGARRSPRRTSLHAAMLLMTQFPRRRQLPLAREMSMRACIKAIVQCISPVHARKFAIPPVTDEEAMKLYAMLPEMLSHWDTERSMNVDLKLAMNFTDRPSIFTAVLSFCLFRERHSIDADCARFLYVLIPQAMHDMQDIDPDMQEYMKWLLESNGEKPMEHPEFEKTMEMVMNGGIPPSNARFIELQPHPTLGISPVLALYRGFCVGTSKVLMDGSANELSVFVCRSVILTKKIDASRLFVPHPGVSGLRTVQRMMGHMSDYGNCYCRSFKQGASSAYCFDVNAPEMCHTRSFSMFLRSLEWVTWTGADARPNMGNLAGPCILDDDELMDDPARHGDSPVDVGENGCGPLIYWTDSLFISKGTANASAACTQFVELATMYGARLGRESRRIGSGLDFSSALEHCKRETSQVHQSDYMSSHHDHNRIGWGMVGKKFIKRHLDQQRVYVTMGMQSGAIDMKTVTNIVRYITNWGDRRKKRLYSEALRTSTV